MILVEDCSYFASPFLSKLLNVDLYVLNNTYNNFFNNLDKALPIKVDSSLKKLPKYGNITVIAYKALKIIEPFIDKYDNVNIILCDTESCVNHTYWNNLVKKNNHIKLFLMPDLYRYSNVDFNPIYQYIDLSYFKDIQKYDKLTISHSPRTLKKQEAKGTNLIINTINELQLSYDFDFKLISGVNYIEANTIKSKSHIFIDQIIMNNKQINQNRFGNQIIYNGGLGKSGLEAMLLNNIVIVGGEYYATKHYDKPEITWVNSDNFKTNLIYLLNNIELFNDKLNKQNNWLNKFYNKDFYVNYLNYGK